MSVLPELLLKRSPYPVETRELDPPATRRIGIACRHVQSLSPEARQVWQYFKNAETLL